MITRPATGHTPPGSDLIDPPTWSLRGFQLLAPALIAACQSGDGDTITDLCAAPEPPSLTPPSAPSSLLRRSH